MASEVPEVTLAFWVIKIAATTLGETGGDTVTMTLGWGYLAGTACFLAALIVLVTGQILTRRFQPLLYWAAIVASTTFGTTMADFADRSLGIGYTGGSALLLLCLAAVLGLGGKLQSVMICAPAEGCPAFRAGARDRNGRKHSEDGADDHISQKQARSLCGRGG